MVADRNTDAFGTADRQMMEALLAQAGPSILNAMFYDDLAQKSQETAALYRLSSDLASLRTPEEIFERVVDQMQSLLHVRQIAFFRLNSSASRLNPVLCRGVTKEEMGNPGVDEGLAGWCAQWLLPLIVPDTVLDPRDSTAPLPDRICSLMAVPVTLGHQTLGVLLAMSGSRRLFDAHELRLMEALAHHLAEAEDYARTHLEARTRFDEMEDAFHRMAEGLSGSQAPLTLVADLALRAVGASHGALYSFQGETLTPLLQFPNSSADPCQDLACWVTRSQRILAIPCLDQDSRATRQVHRNAASYLGVPLRCDGRLVGVLEVFTEEPRLWSQPDIARTIALLDQFGLSKRLGPPPVRP